MEDINCLNCNKCFIGFTSKGETRYYCEIDEETECVIQEPENTCCSNYEPNED